MFFSRRKAKIDKVYASNPFWEGSTYRKENIDENFYEEVIDLSEYKNELKYKYYYFHPYSYRDFLEHRNDIIKNIGYNYRGKVLKNTLAKILFLEKKRELLLLEIERVIDYIIDHIKSIKHFVNYTFSKKWREFN